MKIPFGKDLSTTRELDDSKFNLDDIVSPPAAVLAGLPSPSPKSSGRMLKCFLGNNSNDNNGGRFAISSPTATYSYFSPRLSGLF